MATEKKTGCYKNLDLWYVEAFLVNRAKTETSVHPSPENYTSIYGAKVRLLKPKIQYSVMKVYKR